MPSPTKPSSSPTAPLDSPSQPTSAANQSTAAPLNSFPSVSTPTKGSTAAASAPNSPESAIDTTLLTFGSLSLTDQPQHGPPMLAGATVDSYRNFPLLLRPGTEGLTREGAAVALGEVTTAPGQALRRGKCKFFNASKGFGFILDSDSPSINGDEVFVHYSAIEAVQGGPHAFRALVEGEDVEYYVVRGPKGWQAQHVTGPQGSPCIGSPPGSPKSFSYSSPSHRTPPRPSFGSPLSQHTPLWSPALSESRTQTDSGFQSPISSYSPLDSPYQHTTSLPPYPYYPPPHLHDPHSYAPFSPPFAPYDPHFPPPFSSSFSPPPLSFSPPSSYPPKYSQPSYPPPSTYIIDPNAPWAFYPPYSPPFPMQPAQGYFIQEGYGDYAHGPPPMMMARWEEPLGGATEGAGDRERREGGNSGGETA